MNLGESWQSIRDVFREAFRSSFHYAIASVNADGTPHVTPIGSLLLTGEGKGIYFEILTSQLPRNIERQPRVCVLAVNTSRWYWLISLWRGRFATSPALRLAGTAGRRRPATASEKRWFRKRLRHVRRLRGYDLLWGKLDHVREIEFDTCEPVALGALTPDL